MLLNGDVVKWLPLKINVIPLDIKTRYVEDADTRQHDNDGKPTTHSTSRANFCQQS